MKIVLILTSLIFLIGLGDSKEEAKMVENKNTFELGKGLNVSHWLSQSMVRGEDRKNYMTEKDFVLISELGFDHVRLPIDEEQMWNENGEKELEAFELLHNAINWCFKNNLRVIVDLHVIRSHHFNDPNNRELWHSKEAQESFIKCWHQLSDELKQYPLDKLAYEPLNEAVSENPKDWNNLINWVISEIRKLEPQRTIIMGSNNWQTVATFKDLQVPKNDENIILSFHYYEPFLITHYQASWTSIKDLNAPVFYPGPHLKKEDYEKLDDQLKAVVDRSNQNFNLDSIDVEIKQAVDVAKKHGLKLYCGEFGCYPSTDIEIRKRLYKDMMKVFNKYDIAWAHWNYKNDFPVVDSNLNPIRELTDILTQK